ncbi:hypothetical protein CRENBAI_010359 [Crenichthys baileyi]|uniref:Uncharacterized protein n=1 Tax=Crenichthys baileyi TaxID=28760 RepID=A0AAV9R0L1_9TELE
MLCPLLQSPAVKATVNPDGHSASQHRNAQTQMCADANRRTHTLPSLRSRGPDKIGDGGDSSEDSTAGALHLLTDSYAWRSLKAQSSHTHPAYAYFSPHPFPLSVVPPPVRPHPYPDVCPPFLTLNPPH